MPVGIFGAGAMGQKHLEAWRSLNVPIAGLYARNVERGRVLADVFEVPVYGSVAGLLRDAEIADICLPTFLHRATAEAAANARRQIVCEKPLALTCDDAEAIFEACEAAGVRIFVAMVVRFFPAYRAIAKSVLNGSVGVLQEISLKRVGKIPGEDRPWFSDAGLSGGILFDLLIHDIDYALWLAGNVHTVHATLETTGRTGYAHLTLEHLNGVVTKIEGGWVESIDNLETTVRVVGAQEVLESASHLPASSLDLAEEDPYAAQLRHFLSSLENKAPFEVTRSEVLDALRVATAAQTSIERRRVISVTATSPAHRLR